MNSPVEVAQKKFESAVKSMLVMVVFGFIATVVICTIAMMFGLPWFFALLIGLWGYSSMLSDSIKEVKAADDQVLLIKATMSSRG